MKKLILLATVCLLTGCDALSESKVKPLPSNTSSATPAPIASETPGPTSSGLPTPSPMPSAPITANSPTVSAVPPATAPIGSNTLSQIAPPTTTYSTIPSPSAKVSGQKLPSPSQVMPSPSDLSQTPLFGSNDGSGFGGNKPVKPKPASPLTISEGGIGAIKVGMTLGDVKKNLKNKATFENKPNFATGYNALAVVQQGKVQFYIPYQKQRKITDADRVRYLVTENPVYKTPEGVAPGMTIKRATTIYGSAKLALNRQMQAEEMVVFASQPAELRFFSSSTNSKNRAGIYPKNKGEALETEKYTDSGRIKRIAIICQESVCGADQPEQ